jgi:FMN phosphatase YigB (HAD superfamily)/sugar phosphate isomerase/epimerase
MSELIPILENATQTGNKKPQRGVNGDYKALFFDAGDILYHRPNSGKNLRKFLKGIPLQPHTDLEKERARLKSMAFEDQICRHEYYKKIIGLYGIVDPDLLQKGVRAMEQDDLTVEIVDGVRDTLLCLKERGYILGIITDTALPIHIKLGWFEEHGFGHIWDTVVSSREIRVRKPSPRIYQEAVQQIGLQPGETVFVGHKTAELMGAHKYGMRTVAFNYDKDAPADIYIQQFSDLLNLYPGSECNHPGRQVPGTPVLYDAALSTMWNIKQAIPFPETFEVARKIGFNRFELNHQLPPELIEQIDLSQNRIGSLHDPCPATITMDEQKERDWMISSLDETCRNQGVAIVKKTIDQAVSLHARLVVIHPGSIVADSHLDRKLRKLFKEGLTASQEYLDIRATLMDDRKTRAQPHLDSVVRSLKEIIDYVRPTGISIGLENRYRYYDIPVLDELEVLLDLTDEDWYGFQYDVGHAQTLDKLGLCSHESWLKRYARRMVGVHLHDVIGIMDHQKPGSGEVDFKMVASYLSEKVYRTVEVSPQLSVEDISAGMEVLTQFGCVNRL